MLTMTMSMETHIIIMVEGIEDIVGETGEEVDEEPGLEMKQD